MKIKQDSGSASSVGDFGQETKSAGASSDERFQNYAERCQRALATTFYPVPCSLRMDTGIVLDIYIYIYIYIYITNLLYNWLLIVCRQFVVVSPSVSYLSRPA